jgi:hypothetical protein
MVQAQIDVLERLAGNCSGVRLTRSRGVVLASVIKPSPLMSAPPTSPISHCGNSNERRTTYTDWPDDSKDAGPYRRARANVKKSERRIKPGHGRGYLRSRRREQGDANFNVA